MHLFDHLRVLADVILQAYEDNWDANTQAGDLFYPL